MLDTLGERIAKLRRECEDLTAQRTAVAEDISRLSPFSSLPEDVDKLVHYRFVQVRFGRIQREYYEKFKPMFTITWIPCSIPVRKMPTMSGDFILFCGQRWSRWTQSSLPCILNGSI